jgi:hypothetical protein
MDITATVRRGLLPPLQEKLAEVEARLGQAVTFDQDSALPGMASAQTSVEALRSWQATSMSSHSSRFSKDLA